MISASILLWGGSSASPQAGASEVELAVDCDHLNSTNDGSGQVAPRAGSPGESGGQQPSGQASAPRADSGAGERSVNPAHCEPVKSQEPTTEAGPSAEAEPSPSTSPTAKASPQARPSEAEKADSERERPESAPTSGSQPKEQEGLEIAKSVSSRTARPDDTVTYTVTITNPRTSDYKNATVTDDLTDVLKKAEYAEDAEADGGLVSFAAPRLTWRGDVPAGGTVTVTYSVTVKEGARTGDRIGSRVVGPVDSTCSRGSRSRECLAETEVPGKLKLKKTADKSVGRTGETVAYTLTISNPGSAHYESATVTDDLTQVLTKAVYRNDAQADNGSVSFADRKLIWHGVVPAGGAVVVTYSVKIKPGATGTLQNRVVGPADSNCPAQSSNPDCSTRTAAEAKPAPQAPGKPGTERSLVIRKAVSPNPVKAGGNATQVLSISNPGTVARTNVTVTDDLSGMLAQAAYNGDAKASSGRVSFAAPRLTWLGDVPAGDTVLVTYSVKVKPRAVGKLRSLAVGPADSNCAAGAENPDCSGEIEATPHGARGLDVKKGVSDPGAKPGKRVDHTLTITNTSGADLADASVSDNLTKQLAKADYMGMARATSGTVAYASPTLTWRGDLAAGQKVVVTYSMKIKAHLGGSPGKPARVPCPPGVTGAGCVPADQAPTLRLRKSVDRATALPGQKLRYTLTITNTRSVDAKNTVVFEDLTGLLGAARYNKDAAADKGSVAYVEPQLMWTGDIPAGDTVTVGYSVTAGAKLKGSRTLTNLVTSPENTNCPKPVGAHDMAAIDPGCTTTTIVEMPPVPFGPEDTEDIGDADVIDATNADDGMAAFGEPVESDEAEVVEEAAQAPEPLQDPEPMRPVEPGREAAAEGTALSQTGLGYEGLASIMAAILLAGGAAVFLMSRRIGRDES